MIVPGSCCRLKHQFDRFNNREMRVRIVRSLLAAVTQFYNPISSRLKKSSARWPCSNARLICR